jgi:hypothetical protein
VAGRYGLQFLDETVLVRADAPGARQRRAASRSRAPTRSRFSDTGNNRRDGAIVMLGGELQDLQLEPYQLH